MNGQHDKQTCQEATDDLATKKFFAILGVDVDRPEQVEEFREDLRFGRRLRKIADRGTVAFIGVVAAALAAAVWAGIVSNITGGK